MSVFFSFVSQTPYNKKNTCAARHVFCYNMGSFERQFNTLEKLLRDKQHYRA